MPELPEVETIVRVLSGDPRTGSQPSVIGRRILGVEVLAPGSLAEPDAETFRRMLPGAEITGLTRRAKYLVFALNQDMRMLVHLRMSGDLTLGHSDVPPEPHDRIRWHLSGGTTLSFNDQRRFGRVWLLPAKEAREHLAELGPEPLEDEFTAKVLGQQLAGRSKVIKAVLLDQDVIAGVGNIHADEALHRAGLHPLISASALSPDDVRALWRGIRATLRFGIDDNARGIDWVHRPKPTRAERIDPEKIADARSSRGFRVYGREGEPCRNCGTPIEKLKVAQRGTHYCPSCQRLPAKGKKSARR